MWRWIAPQLELLQTIGGLTVSGGEALLQADAVSQLLRYCRKEGFHTAIETSGTLPRNTFEQVSEWVDCWLFGLRPTSIYAPPHAEQIAENLSFVSSTGSRVIIRTPLMAGITDTPESLSKIATTMHENRLTELELLPFNRETPHFYRALGRNCTVGDEAHVTPEDLHRARDYFAHRGIEARILT